MEGFRLIRETSVTRMQFQYDNTCLEGRDSLYRHLDLQYGQLGYKVKRSGPMIEDYQIVQGFGMMIVEVEYKVT